MVKFPSRERKPREGEVGPSSGAVTMLDLERRVLPEEEGVPLEDSKLFPRREEATACGRDATSGGEASCSTGGKEAACGTEATSGDEWVPPEGSSHEEAGLRLRGTFPGLSLLREDNRFLGQRVSPGQSREEESLEARRAGAKRPILFQRLIESGGYHAFGGRCYLAGTRKDLPHHLRSWFEEKRMRGFPVGWDLEWKPDRGTNGDQRGNPVALMQFSDSQTCILLKIIESGLQKEVKELLLEKRCRKICVGYEGSDRKKFRETFGFEPEGIHDLSPGGEGLRSVCDRVGLRLLKSQRITTTDWGGWLSIDQLRYAAEDAYFPFLAYSRLLSLQLRRGSVFRAGSDKEEIDLANYKSVVGLWRRAQEEIQGREAPSLNSLRTIQGRLPHLTPVDHYFLSLGKRREMCKSFNMDNCAKVGCLKHHSCIICREDHPSIRCPEKRGHDEDLGRAKKELSGRSEAEIVQAAQDSLGLRSWWPKETLGRDDF